MSDAAANPKNTSKGRAGSRKIRVYVFREWLMRTYGSYLSRELAYNDVDDGYFGVGDDPKDPERTSNDGNDSPQSSSNENKKRKRPDHSHSRRAVVLDVAGGKGDLSWLLKNVDGLESIVVDPWKPNPNTVSRNERMVRSIEYLRNNPGEATKRSVPGLPTYQPLAELLPKLLEERHKRLRKKENLSPSDSEESLQASGNGNEGPCVAEDFLTPRTLHVPLDEAMVQKVRNRILLGSGQHQTRKLASDNGSEPQLQHKHEISTAAEEDDDVALDVLSSGRIKLIVGFHPDQATEPCLDLARVLGIPYCVVPCCVFPAEFPNRRLRRTAPLSALPSPSIASSIQWKDGNASNSDHKKDGNNSNEQLEETLVPVRTYMQFLDYLRQKATALAPKTSGFESNGYDSPITLRTSYLNFPFTETAKNIVLYTLPSSQSPTDGSV